MQTRIVSTQNEDGTWTAKVVGESPTFVEHGPNGRFFLNTTTIFQRTAKTKFRAETEAEVWAIAFGG